LLKRRNSRRGIPGAPLVQRNQTVEECLTAEVKHQNLKGQNFNSGENRPTLSRPCRQPLALQGQRCH